MMSNINNYGANMKGTMAKIIAGTLLVITVATLSVLATVSNINSQYLTSGQQLLLATNFPVLTLGLNQVLEDCI